MPPTVPVPPSPKLPPVEDNPDAPGLGAAIGAELELSEPATTNADDVASGLPEASEAAIVTVAGDVAVPPITRAFCTIELAVKLAPALTTVSPVPVIAPTC